MPQRVFTALAIFGAISIRRRRVPHCAAADSELSFATRRPLMNPDALYTKTAAGQAEIGRRSDRLSRPLRNLLLCVDGKRDVAALQALIASIGAPPDALEQLRSLGLIAGAAVVLEPAAGDGPADAAPVAAEAGADSPHPLERLDFATLYKALNALVADNLGMIKGVRLQLSIEQCHTVEQLRALVPAVEAALSARHGSAKAATLLAEFAAAPAAR